MARSLAGIKRPGLSCGCIRTSCEAVRLDQDLTCYNWSLAHTSAEFMLLEEVNGVLQHCYQIGVDSWWIFAIGRFLPEGAWAARPSTRTRVVIRPAEGNASEGLLVNLHRGFHGVRT